MSYSFILNTLSLDEILQLLLKLTVNSIEMYFLLSFYGNFSFKLRYSFFFKG